MTDMGWCGLALSAGVVGLWIGIGRLARGARSPARCRAGAFIALLGLAGAAASVRYTHPSGSDGLTGRQIHQQAQAPQAQPQAPVPHPSPELPLDRGVRMPTDAGELWQDPKDARVQWMGVTHDHARFDAEGPAVLHAIHRADVLVLESGAGYFAPLARYAEAQGKVVYYIDTPERAQMLAAMRWGWWGGLAVLAGLLALALPNARLGWAAAVVGLWAIVSGYPDPAWVAAVASQRYAPIGWGSLSEVTDGRTLAMLERLDGVRATLRSDQHLLAVVGVIHRQGFAFYRAHPWWRAVKAQLVRPSRWAEGPGPLAPAWRADGFGVPWPCDARGSRRRIPGWEGGPADCAGVPLTHPPVESRSLDAAIRALQARSRPVPAS